MTVYTRVGRRSGISIPFWALPLYLPFYTLYLSVVLLVAGLVLTFRVSVAVLGFMATVASREAGKHVVR